MRTLFNPWKALLAGTLLLALLAQPICRAEAQGDERATLRERLIADLSDFEVPLEDGYLSEYTEDPEIG